MSINFKNTGAISSLSRINCSLCKNIFSDINNFKRHIIRCHQDFLVLREKEENLTNALALKNTLDEHRYAWKSIPLHLFDKFEKNKNSLDSYFNVNKNLDVPSSQINCNLMLTDGNVASSTSGSGSTITSSSNSTKKGENTEENIPSISLGIINDNEVINSSGLINDQNCKNKQSYINFSCKCCEKISDFW